MLFRRCVSGTRVVARGDTKTMQQGHVFPGYGSSYDAYPHAYLTAACAIGVHPAELDEFLVRLDKTLREFSKQQQQQEKKLQNKKSPLPAPENTEKTTSSPPASI